MCSRDSDRRTIAAHVTSLQSKKGQQFCDSALVDGAECEELIDARRKFAVFNVRDPCVRQIVLLAVLFLRNLPTFRLHIAGGQSQAHTQFLQLLSGTRTGLTYVHWRKSYAGSSSMSSHLTLHLCIHRLYTVCGKSRDWSQLRPVQQLFPP